VTLQCAHVVSILTCIVAIGESSSRLGGLYFDSVVTIGEGSSRLGIISGGSFPFLI